MKLNPDCIRDILISVEEVTTPNRGFSYSSDSELPAIKKYDRETLYYHFHQADLSGLLFDTSYDMSGNFFCTDLSPAGHSFLNNVRSDNNWNKTKEIAKGVGTNSLDALKTIATGVISGLINQHLGL